jgi:hypothetical protein
VDYISVRRGKGKLSMHLQGDAQPASEYRKTSADFDKPIRRPHPIIFNSEKTHVILA